MDLEEKFKFIKSVNLSNKQKNNITSNWLLILGGLKEVKENKKLEQVNKYGIIHIIRQIDGYSYYPITNKLYDLLQLQFPNEQLKRLKTDEGYIMNSSLRTRFNKLLKQNNIEDSIQIEHLNGGVKILVEKIIESELSLTKIKNLHRDHTLCCYKLKSESDINESTRLEEIKLAPKQRIL